MVTPVSPKIPQGFRLIDTDDMAMRNQTECILSASLLLATDGSGYQFKKHQELESLNDCYRWDIGLSCISLLLSVICIIK
jgi:hypothetical protein